MTIINPDGAAERIGATGAQFAAAITEALATGFAKSLAQQLQKLTMSDGPWILHADGRVEAMPS